MKIPLTCNTHTNSQTFRKADNLSLRETENHTWPPIYAKSQQKQQEQEQVRGPTGVASSSVHSTAGVHRSGDMTQQVLLGSLWLSASDWQLRVLCLLLSPSLLLWPMKC